MKWLSMVTVKTQKNTPFSLNCELLTVTIKNKCTYFDFALVDFCYKTCFCPTAVKNHPENEEKGKVKLNRFSK